MTSSPKPPDRFFVLGVPVHATNLSDCTRDLIGHGASGKKGLVIFRDIHGVIRCQDDQKFMQVHHQAFRVCPDGMPLVWIGRHRGHQQTDRVYGPDLMRALFEATRNGSKTHYLYGGAPGVAEKLKRKLEQDYPGASIVGTRCPPYGPLSSEDEEELIKEIHDLKPDFFWVGLSTPKQEAFMADYLDHLDTSIMLGVGAAFDYLSGGVKEPPPWLRKSGFQWLARVLQEPRRLWKRYLATIPRFCFLYIRDRIRSGTQHP